MKQSHRQAISDGMVRATARRRQARAGRETRMETTTKMKVSEFVEKNVEGHDLIALEPFLTALLKETDAELAGAQELKDGVEYVVRIGEAKVSLYGQTFGMFEAELGVDVAGPKGVTLGADVDREKLAIPGYSLSDALAFGLTGRSSTMMGRGSRFRQNLQIVREAGF